jgi:hypothetical protein
MVSLAQLWLPILASAIGVFIASSLVHMVLKWHNTDYRKLPNEDEVRGALKSSANAPGMYFVPHMMDHKEIAKPENAQKFVEGPIALITIRPPGPPKMGPYLVQWFVLSLLVSVIAGYLASRTVPAGASFLAVCRPTSVVAFMAYGIGSITDGIWWGRPWPTVAKDLIDAAIYAVVTACAFAALWPAAA